MQYAGTSLASQFTREDLFNISNLFRRLSEKILNDDSVFTTVLHLQVKQDTPYEMYMIRGPKLGKTTERRIASVSLIPRQLQDNAQARGKRYVTRFYVQADDAGVINTLNHCDFQCERFYGVDAESLDTLSKHIQAFVSQNRFPIGNTSAAS